MAFKQFLQNLFERVGLAEAPMPAPHLADVALAEPEHLQPILLRLTAWGVKRVRFIADEAVDPADLLRAVQETSESGFEVSVRGRATDLSAGKLLKELAAAGAGEVELPVLSAVAEVHNALGGMGDARYVLTALETLAGLKLPAAAQLVLVPSTINGIERTLQMLDDRGVQAVRAWAIVCRDDEPASWAVSAGELLKAAARLEQSAPKSMEITWYPPQKFDPAETLAQQVRRGPRAAMRQHADRARRPASMRPPSPPSPAARFSRSTGSSSPAAKLFAPGSVAVTSAKHASNAPASRHAPADACEMRRIGPWNEATPFVII